LCSLAMCFLLFSTLCCVAHVSLALPCCALSSLCVCHALAGVRCACACVFVFRLALYGSCMYGWKVSYGESTSISENARRGNCCTTTECAVKAVATCWAALPNKRKNLWLSVKRSAS
jgi:hypothetical protein